MRLEKVITNNELNRLLELIRQIWPPHYTPIIGRQQVDYMMATYQSREEIQRQLNFQADYFILVVDNSDAGYMAYEKRPGGLYLSKLYLLESMRGRGLGRYMEEYAVKSAKESGLNHIYLNVNRHNTNSVKVYEKLGYKVEREMIKNLGEGFYMDDYVMGKYI